MKINNPIGVHSTVSIEGQEAKVVQSIHDSKKVVYRAETDDGKEFQFIVSNDRSVSKVYEVKR